MELDPRKPFPASANTALSHLINIKMKNSKLPNNTIQIESGGPQPVTLTPISFPRKDSQNVTKRTLLNRRKQTK